MIRLLKFCDDKTITQKQVDPKKQQHQKDREGILSNKVGQGNVIPGAHDTKCEIKQQQEVSGIQLVESGYQCSDQSFKRLSQVVAMFYPEPGTNLNRRGFLPGVDGVMKSEK